MVVDFAFTAEGFAILQKYNDKFDCRFRIDEPAGDSLLLDTGESSYKIDEDESVEAFKAMIEESLNTGRNLLLEKYRSNKIQYEDDVVY